MPGAPTVQSILEAVRRIEEANARYEVAGERWHREVYEVHIHASPEAEAALDAREIEVDAARRDLEQTLRDVLSRDEHQCVGVFERFFSDLNLKHAWEEVANMLGHVASWGGSSLVSVPEPCANKLAAALLHALELYENMGSTSNDMVDNVQQCIIGLKRIAYRDGFNPIEFWKPGDDEGIRSALIDLRERSGGSQKA